MSTAVASKAESSALTALANSVPTQINTEIAALVGTAPSTLNTLQELASALNNDQNYAATIQTQLGNKANSSDVYTKSVIDTKLLAKQGTLVFTDPTGGANLGSNNNVNWVKGIKGSGPIAVSSDNVNDVVNIELNQTTSETTLASNFYNRTTADSTFYNKTKTDFFSPLNKIRCNPHRHLVLHKC